MTTIQRYNLRECHHGLNAFCFVLFVFVFIAGSLNHTAAQTLTLTPRPQFLPLQQGQTLPPADKEEIARVIRDAQTYEAQFRWADAMTHYETAMRLHSYDAALMDRYRIARFHYDVNRRLHDASYINLVTHNKLDATVSFFNEVMNCVEAEYADTPNWDNLFRSGITNLQIALGDSNFCNKTGLKISPQRVAELLQEVQTMVDRWDIRNREDLKNGLFHIAEKAKTQIGLNPVTVIMEFTCGVINSLDVYSTYLTPRQLSDQYSMISGNLVGLGVELRSDNTSLLIVRVIPGSPAEENGLKEGDRILSVDGISTQGRDTDSAADLLQGPEGTAARLVISRPEFSSDYQSSVKTVKNELRFNIVRRQIDVPSVEEGTMLTDKVGYVRLTSFQTKTAAELNKAMISLHRQGMQSLVLDMRGNPGGLFQVGIEVANMFIDSGAIVRTQGRDNSLDAPFLATAENTWRMPLAVLIDEDSASAAEIVAGALRDHRRATLVGRRTYGKGTVQKILPLRSGMYDGGRSGLKLTVEKFYSPKGWAYSGVGVTPDVAVQDNKPEQDGKQRITAAKPINGQIPRLMTSRLDDPFIKEAVKALEN
ncbi:MAG: S41 family peptidase [Planctomycetaceae bacterium]|jgi:carboxyl-terminal processing protease|nr:S41 family peptidase [Planctomycetaceae bacterium]